jgi:hypothetical protein
MEVQVVYWSPEMNYDTSILEMPSEIMNTEQMLIVGKITGRFVPFDKQSQKDFDALPCGEKLLRQLQANSEQKKTKNS